MKKNSIKFIIICIGISVLIFYFCINKANIQKTEVISIVDTTGNFKTEKVLNDMIEISVDNENNWNSDNLSFCQYKIKIKNTNEESFKNWKLNFEIGDNVKFSQGWNGDFLINDGILTITPVEYNTEIQSNNTIEIGIILIGQNISFEKYDFWVNDEKIETNSNSDENNKAQIKEIVDINKIKDNLNKNILYKILKEGVLQIKISENTKFNENSGDSTPVAKHHKLSVDGTNIIDYKGEIVQLRGVSTHSIYEYPEYINEETFKEMRDVWGINVVRIAMYSNPDDGYSTALHEKVKEAVNIANDLGLYVIVDWHILSDNNPNMYKDNAIAFFEEMATEFKDYENVLYEICNEPNGVTWEGDVKPYAEELISKIRAIDSDKIIIVGTPTWSQDVDIVADKRIEGYENIMYTLHFYAATHKSELRSKLEKAIQKGLPVFVTEFGISDASGDGTIDEEEGDKWIDELNSNNISWVCWNLSNKNESSALINSECDKTSGFDESDLSQEGQWLLKKLSE